MQQAQSAAPTPISMQRATGVGRISTSTRNAQTALAVLYQEGCAKIRLPNTHGPGMEAVLLNTAGGLTGGDRMDWSITASNASRLVLTTPACERIYRSTGDNAEVRTTIEIGAGAHVDWLPQETILFERSRLRRRLEVRLAGDARFTGIESVLIGRDAMGEMAEGAVFEDNWRIWRDGRLLHAEATRLSARHRERVALSLLAGARAFATIVHIGSDSRTLLASLRRDLPADPSVGTSVDGDRLVVRVIARSGLALRRLIVPLLSRLTSAGMLPRLWHS